MVIRSSVRGITELRNELTEFIFLIRTITRLRNIIIYLSKPATNFTLVLQWKIIIISLHPYISNYMPGVYVTFKITLYMPN